MKAYKLIRKMKDSSLSPLFINQKSRIPIGVWMDAEFHPKKVSLKERDGIAHLKKMHHTYLRGVGFGWKLK